MMRRGSGGVGIWSFVVIVLIWVEWVDKEVLGSEEGKEWE